MRILLAAKTMGVGGLERIVVGLARELQSRGHSVWVVSSGGNLVDDAQRAVVEGRVSPYEERTAFVVGQLLSNRVGVQSPRRFGHRVGITRIQCEAGVEPSRALHEQCDGRDVSQLLWQRQMMQIWHGEWRNLDLLLPTQL